ncbi:MAG: hypothetical protein AAGJ32_07650 [Pseudomonadota bacterium]
MTSRPHPLDDPSLAALWPALIALSETLFAIMNPCLHGAPVFLETRRRVRAALRYVEAVLRRALLTAAFDLAALDKQPARAQSSEAEPGKPVLPADAQSGQRRTGARHPFGRFRLHETGPTDCTRRGWRAADGHDPDPYGLQQVPSHAEWHRYLRICLAMQNPAPIIRRLARIIRRRSRTSTQDTGVQLPAYLAPFDHARTPIAVERLPDPPPLPVPKGFLDLSQSRRAQALVPARATP